MRCLNVIPITFPFMLLRPIITEKTSKQGEGQYVFHVLRNGNKIEIQKEVKRLFKVDVEKVRIINTPSKKRRLGRFNGEKPGVKKAIVVLKKGQKITSL